MTGRTILGWLALAFVVWFGIVDPHGTAQIMTNIRHWETSALHGLLNFFASI